MADELPFVVCRCVVIPEHADEAHLRAAARSQPGEAPCNICSAAAIPASIIACRSSDSLPAILLIQSQQEPSRYFERTQG